MIFQAKWRNSTYILRKSSYKTTDFGRDLVPGLIAKFKGPQRLFDSVATAEALGWSDKERVFVEDKLLGHKDFGNGIYLAPGEQLTEAQKKKVKNTESLAPSRVRCQKFWVEDGDIKQCNAVAVPGTQYCSEPGHNPQEPRIIKGMQTTAD